MKKIILCLTVLMGFTMSAQFTWNNNGTGVQSIYSTASGYYSTSLGVGNFATGYYSTAMGNGTTASDYVSLVIGRYNSSGSSVTTGGSATAFDTDNTAFVIGNGASSLSKSDAFKVLFNGDATVGNDLTVSSDVTIGGNLTVSGTLVGAGNLVSVTESSNTGVRLSTAVAANHGDIGSNAVDLSFSDGGSNTRGATGTASIAMGYKTTASGNYSTAIGDNSVATGSSSVSIGSYTTASGSRSTAMGDGASAADYASLTIGRYNSVNKTVTTGGNATSFDTDNAAFVIGNGTLWNATSDAFVVYFNGNATLSGDLTINSDARLKDNIQPLGSTLDKLHQIEAKTYSIKKDEEHTPKIGVLAQEVQLVFPELVNEGADGILSVNYQGLVPVLINAINEQELKMSEQDAKIAALEEMVRFLAVQQSQATSSVASN